MDPVSALAGVAGLVASLETILRTLQNFTYTFASRRLDVVYMRDEDTLGKLRWNLDNLLSHQSSLHTVLKDAPVEELLRSLQVIENKLDTLQEIVQNAEKYRKIRWFRRALWRRDTEDAATSILLAKNVIRMIRTLQELGHGENIPIANIRYSISEPSPAKHTKWSLD